MNTQTETSPRCALADGSALWAVACLLTKHTATGVVFTQTLSWRRGVTENEAKGEAVTFAMKERPGYAIEMVTATEIPSPNNKLSNAGQPTNE